MTLGGAHTGPAPARSSGARAGTPATLTALALAAHLVACGDVFEDPRCRAAGQPEPSPAACTEDAICAPITSCAACVSTYPCGWSAGECWPGSEAGPARPLDSAEWVYDPGAGAGCAGASVAVGTLGGRGGDELDGTELIRALRSNPGYEPFGMNHVISWADLGENPDAVWRKKLSGARDAGVQFIRGHGMHMLEMVEDDYATLDRIVRINEDYDFKILHVFSDYDPRLFTDGVRPAEWWTTPGWLDEWESEVAETAVYFAGRVRYWQLGNEPNNIPDFPPEVYAELLIRFHRGVKAADASNIVVWGGLGEKRYHGGPVEYVRRFMAVPGASAAFDVMGIHPYTMFDDMVRPVLDLVGHRETWVDEFGMDDLCSDEARARMLRTHTIRFLTRYPAITKVFWYAYGETVPELRAFNLVDIRGSGADTEFVPLPPYYAHQTLEAETRPCR